MEHVKKFIEDAVEGGWKPNVVNWESTPHRELYISDFLLQPLAWKAVGKVRGWGTIVIDEKPWKCGKDGYLNAWQANMHRFINYLCNCHTPNEALGTLEDNVKGK